MKKRRKRSNHSNLTFGALEPRQLMAGDLASDWFFQPTPDAEQTQASRTTRSAAAATETAEWSGAATEVESGEWLLQVSSENLIGNSPNEVAKSIQNAFPNVEVIAGTGRVGQLHVKTSLSYQDAMAQFDNASMLDDFEPVQILNATDFETQNSPNNDLSSQQWALNKIGAPSAWAQVDGDQNFVVAVVDTGVDYTHPDLQNRMWRNPGEIAGNGIDDDGNGFTDDVFGVDFANGDSDPFDDHAHGTHVAGIIGAERGDGQGIDGVSQSKIMALKFLKADNTGTTVAAIQSINYINLMKTSFDVDIRVANHSWGGGRFSQALLDAFSNSEDAGILSVVAAGNNSSNNDVSSYYPANYDVGSIITVANSTEQDTLSFTSNYGPSEVDLAAPGTGILSSVPGGRYSFFSGTSMAAPQVAASAALVWAANPSLTNFEVRQVLLDTADKVHNGKTSTDGRLNVGKAVEAAIGTPTDPPIESGIPTNVNVLAIRENNQTNLLDWHGNNDKDNLQEFTFEYGFHSDKALVGDINGVGRDSLIAIRGGYDDGLTRWFIDTDGDKFQERQLTFGFDSDTHLIGDFDGNGSDNIAVVRGQNDGLARWYYNADNNTDPAAEFQSVFGFASDQFLLADMTGDGKANRIAIRGGYADGLARWFVDTDNDPAAEMVFVYGFETDTFLAQDLNGDGVADPIAVRGGFADGLARWHVGTDLDPNPELIFTYGFDTDRFLIGDVEIDFESQVSGALKNASGSPSQPANQKVFLDKNLNGTLDVLTDQQFRNDEVNDMIEGSDNSYLLGASSKGHVNEVSAELRFTHRRVNDISWQLVSPAGKVVALPQLTTSAPDGGRVTVDVEFSATKPTSLDRSDPHRLTGTIHVAELNDLIGEESTGFWRMEMVDNGFGSDGRYDGWAINLKSGEQATFTDANGQFRFDNLASGHYRIGAELDGNWNLESSDGSPVFFVGESQSVSNIDLSVVPSVNPNALIQYSGHVRIVDGILMSNTDSFKIPLSEIGNQKVIVDDGWLSIEASNKHNVRISDNGNDLILNIEIESDGNTESAEVVFQNIKNVAFFGSEFDDVFESLSQNVDTKAYGFRGNDLLKAAAGENRLFGGAGADRIEGGSENDRLDGGAGHDVLIGNAGDDFLLGRGGNDWMFGNDGNDTLLGGAGEDPIYGGKGDDRLDGNEGNDLLHGDEGNDRLYGNEGNDRMFGGAGNDKMYGHAGNDWMTGGSGDDFVRGNEGNDTIYGDQGNDRLLGDDGQDNLFGQSGDDTLEGGNGADQLFGGLGDDYLRGGNDNDFLNGGQGRNRLRGDAGVDRFEIVYRNQLDNLIEDHEWWNFEWIDWV